MIYCPDCARELFSPGIKQTINVTVRCGCGRYYRIDPQKMKAYQVNISEGVTSSGKRFG